MDVAAIFFATFAFLIVVGFVIVYLIGRDKLRLKDCCSILVDCIRSICPCTRRSTTEEINPEVSDTRETRVTVMTIDEQKLHSNPPAYDSVIAEKNCDPDLPKYEDVNVQTPSVKT
jgi:hypothetical protein